MQKDLAFQASRTSGGSHGRSQASVRLKNYENDNCRDPFRSEPVEKLRVGSFPKVLDMQLGCPKCDTIYNLVVDWDQAANRWFERDSAPLIRLLKKAIFMGHSTDHRVPHFETEGVVVREYELAAHAE